MKSDCVSPYHGIAGRGVEMALSVMNTVNPEAWKRLKEQ
jgi:hypothetical protein